MSHANEAAAMRDALQYLVASDMPAQHKRVLIEALTQALRNEEAEDRRAGLLSEASKDWQPHETEMIAAALQGKVARGWQHADEILMRLAAELHRRPQDVRAKATELGLGIGVDYRLAKARVIPDH